MRHCSRSFDRGRIVALNDASLTIGRGEYVAVTGPSGSGKSTLLDIMCGLEEPTGGEVFFDGRRVRGRASWARIRAARIGFVFQSFYLIPSLTVAENVELAMLWQTKAPAARAARVADLLDQLGIGDRRGQYPMQLSGGERQRVAIARALANRPEMIVADEPTGSLDTQTSVEIIALLEELKRTSDITIVIVTHNPDIAARCDRQVSLVDGHIVADERRQGVQT
ncbi:MAG: ATP-binding cassette domain-containing protein [Limimaricola sp.]|nr:ATP-binding cassette domain-containing protein [Limimaricola sp.]